MKSIHVGPKQIGHDQPTFVIAEIGINHGGDLRTAERLVVAAAECGADAVKFQTYRAEKRVSRDSPIFEILKRCELDADAHRHLRDLACNRGVVFFSTPFDEESIELLESLGVPAYKIASFDIVNLALIRSVAKRGRPLIVSRGMADRAEVARVVATLEESRAPYCLLHCISAYPTPEDQANLAVIRSLQEQFRCPVGYSDHTLGYRVPVLAVAVGACVIEKHFTLDKNTPGPDHRLSADPSDLRRMIAEIRTVETIVGTGGIRMIDVEKDIVPYRRPSA